MYQECFTKSVLFLVSLISDYADGNNNISQTFILFH